MTKNWSRLALYENVMKKYGKLDILINNAGICPKENLLDSTSEEIQDSLNTNTIGPLHLSQLFIPIMISNGFGRIVNVSSKAGQIASDPALFPLYGLTKTILNIITKKMAAEVDGENVLVNCCSPGWVKTDMAPNGHLSVEEGARRVVQLAMFEKGEHNGKFFLDFEVADW